MPTACYRFVSLLACRLVACLRAVSVPSSHCHVIVPSLMLPTRSSAYRSHAAFVPSANGVTRRPSHGRHAVVRTVAMRHSSRPAFRLDACGLLCSRSLRIGVPARCLPCASMRLSSLSSLHVSPRCLPHALQDVACRVVLPRRCACDALAACDRHDDVTIARRLGRHGFRKRSGIDYSVALASPFPWAKHLLRIARGMSIVSRAIRVTGRVRAYMSFHSLVSVRSAVVVRAVFVCQIMPH